jgi:hypothetical protein
MKTMYTSFSEFSRGIKENISPESIGGMGDVILPNGDELGSGDIPSEEDDENKEKINTKSMDFNSFINKSTVSKLVIEKSATDTLADDVSGELYIAKLKGKSATIKATTTTKTWDDGVPVLKYLARGKSKSMSFDLYQRPFQVVHDYAHGWWYFTDGGKWYGLHVSDGYSEAADLPFDMQIPENKIQEGVMSDIHQMIGNHKTFDSFQKEFFKEYGDNKAMKKTKDFLEWLEALYSDSQYAVSEARPGTYTYQMDSEGNTRKVLPPYYGNSELHDKSKELFKKPWKKLSDKQQDEVLAAFAIVEARSINKIQKEYSKVVNDMAEVVVNWKAAKGSGDAKAEASFLAKLKDLTSNKKSLMSELDDAVGIKDLNIELAESVNESMSSYYFDSPSEYGQFSNEAPAKGETKYLVMATNKALFNGQEIRLEGSIRFGSTSKKEILGVFDKESEALTFYKSAMKKPQGTMVSFTVGSVVGVTKFRSQYTEIEGYLATAKVK